MRKVNASDFKCNVTFNHLDNSNSRQPSVIDMFSVQETKDPTDANLPLYKFVDDIYMLFNADRLSRLLSPADLASYIKTLQPHQKSGLDKLTDDQLISFIKSRHIQSASELLAWSDYLSANYESVIADLNAAEPEPAPEPAPEPTPTE